MVTPKGSMSTEGETLQVSVLPYRCSIHTRAACVAGTWLQDWHLPRHQGWTYRAPVREDKIGVSLPLLTPSSSAWPPRLLYRRGRKSRRELLITLYTQLSGMVVYYGGILKIKAVHTRLQEWMDHERYHEELFYVRSDTVRYSLHVAFDSRRRSETINWPLLQAFAAMSMRCAVFWDFMQPKVVVSYRRLG